MLEVLLNYKLSSSLQSSQIEILKHLTHPHSIDVWSLGTIVLEIIIGIPL